MWTLSGVCCSQGSLLELRSLSQVCIFGKKCLSEGYTFFPKSLPKVLFLTKTPKNWWLWGAKLASLFGIYLLEKEYLGGNSSKSCKKGLMSRKFSSAKGMFSTQISLAKGVRSKGIRSGAAPLSKSFRSTPPPPTPPPPPPPPPWREYFVLTKIFGIWSYRIARPNNLHLIFLLNIYISTQMTIRSSHKMLLFGR